MSTAAEVTPISTKFREASAKRIRELMENLSNNAIELGIELKKVRDTFTPLGESEDANRPGWTKWLETEAVVSPQWARRLIQIGDKFAFPTSGTRRLGISILDVLAGDSVPEAARKEITKRAEKGEKITVKDARETVERHRLPGPKAANAQAKEEKRPVLASDGYIYFGTSDEKAKEGDDRRTMVYGVRRALDHLASINLTGNEFLKYALPHQLWEPEEAKVIKRALRWLTSLDDAWDKRP